MLAYHAEYESENKFQLVLQYLGETAYKLNSYASLEIPSKRTESQLPITLVKRRLNKANIELYRLTGLPARAGFRLTPCTIKGKGESGGPARKVLVLSPDGFERSYPNT